MILVDAHVHIYDCFDLEKFFNAANFNFKWAAERLGHGNEFSGILLLAETSKDNWFQCLSKYADGKDHADDRPTGDWRFHRTDERCSLHARSDDKRELFIIAGRQFVTLEGLEVLSLASTYSFPEGLPIRKLIANVRDTGGIPVVPWGFGKWVGRRGKVLNNLLDTAKSSDFFLGDSGNRPFFMPYPSQLKLAKNKNIRCLPGSDSLPVLDGYKRPGNFGFILNNNLPDHNPSKFLKTELEHLPQGIQPYGKLEGLFPFIRNQIAVRLRD